MKQFLRNFVEVEWKNVLFIHVSTAKMFQQVVRQVVILAF